MIQANLYGKISHTTPIHRGCKSAALFFYFASIEKYFYLWPEKKDMEYISMEQAVREIEKNVPSKKELIAELGPVDGLKKYQSIKALTSHSKSGQLGAGRFNQFAEEYGGGKYRAALVVFREV